MVAHVHTGTLQGAAGWGTGKVGIHDLSPTAGATPTASGPVVDTSKAFSVATWGNCQNCFEAALKGIKITAAQNVDANRQASTATSDAETILATPPRVSTVSMASLLRRFCVGPSCGRSEQDGFGSHRLRRLRRLRRPEASATLFGRAVSGSAVRHGRAG